MSRSLLLELATKEIGYTESPPNSNKTKYGEWFGLDGQKWCGIFCSYIFSHAGHPLGIIDFYKGFAGLPFALKHFTAKGRLTNLPKSMDLVLFDWDKGTPKEGSPDHVGFFVKWINKADGIFETIEGNTSAGSNSNGGQVQKRTRNINKVVAFVDPLHLP